MNQGNLEVWKTSAVISIYMQGLNFVPACKNQTSIETTLYKSYFIKTSLQK